MSANRKSNSANKLFLALLGLAFCIPAQSADRGTTTGIASFHAKGEVREYTPGVVVWASRFIGVSMSDGGKGLLHNSGWECSGETTIHEGMVHQSDGFCIVTDQGGDTVNLVWEQTHVPAQAGVAKTKGTYLSGTGKYAGIQGYYTFLCHLHGAMANCKITAGEYRLP